MCNFVLSTFRCIKVWLLRNAKRLWFIGFTPLNFAHVSTPPPAGIALHWGATQWCKYSMNTTLFQQMSSTINQCFPLPSVLRFQVPTPKKHFQITSYMLCHSPWEPCQRSSLSQQLSIQTRRMFLSSVEGTANVAAAHSVISSSMNIFQVWNLW